MRGIGSTARAKPSDGVELVDVAVGFDARMALGHAPAAEQPGVAAVAGFRVDLHGGGMYGDRPTARVGPVTAAAV